MAVGSNGAAVGWTFRSRSAPSGSTDGPVALRRIVNAPDVDISTEVVRYDPDDPSGWYEDGELTLEPIGTEYADRKFVGFELARLLRHLCRARYRRPHTPSTRR